MFEVLYLSGGDFSCKTIGVAHEQLEASDKQNEAERRRGDDSEQKAQNGPGFKPSSVLCGTVATERNAVGQIEQTPAASPEDPSLTLMRYDVTLTTSEACIHLWIAVLLPNKVLGDRLTRGEQKILSLLGLEASWVQRMIDKAPSSGKVCEQPN